MTLPTQDLGRASIDRGRYQQAERLFQAVRRSEALAILIELAESGTPLWEVYNDLAVAALGENDADSAIALLENAVARETEAGTASRNLAALYGMLGKTDKAVALYGRILACRPEDPDARARLVEMLGPPPSPPAGQSTGNDQAILRARYENRPPSPQTIIDLFGNSWKSSLPGESRSGSAPMFDDRRPAWFASQIPGGLHFKAVLELGPFEGYQTYLLDQLGAREITSVEGNSVNFLKCLCLKELYGLRSRLHLGDVLGFLDCCPQRFDAVFASGILYHMQDPIRFIEGVTRLADHIYIWTHHYDPAIAQLTNGQEKHFVPAMNRQVEVGGRKMTLHARSYLMPAYRDNIPLYWEGGQEDLTYWMTKEDLFTAIRHQGFEIAAVEGEGDVNGLPCISFYARRRPAA